LLGRLALTALGAAGRQRQKGRQGRAAGRATPDVPNGAWEVWKPGRGMPVRGSVGSTRLVEVNGPQRAAAATQRAAGQPGRGAAGGRLCAVRPGLPVPWAVAIALKCRGLAALGVGPAAVGTSRRLSGRLPGRRATRVGRAATRYGHGRALDPRQRADLVTHDGWSRVGPGCVGGLRPVSVRAVVSGLRPVLGRAA
jgi:hypothetical protein